MFVNVFVSLSTFRGEAPFAAWVLGVARHTISGRFKKKQHPMVPLEADEHGEFDALAGAGVHETTPLDLYELRERIVTTNAVEQEL